MLGDAQGSSRTLDEVYVITLNLLIRYMYDRYLHRTSISTAIYVDIPHRNNA